MMVAYVAVPSRLIGVKPQRSARNKLAASAVGGAMGAVVSTPPYLLGRLGILMLGSKVLLIPGIVFIAVGFALHAGATGAVKAVEMSAKLIDPKSPTPAQAAVRPPARRRPRRKRRRATGPTRRPAAPIRILECDGRRA